MARDANGHGREPEIDRERTEAFCDALRVGTSLKGAARFAGIAEHTMYGWLRKGRRPDPEQVYREFVEAVDEALAYFEVSTVQELRHSKDTRALRWLLAVRWPDRYSEKRITEHQHAVDVSGWSLEDKEMLLALLERNGEEREEIIEDAEVLELPESV